MKKIIKTTLYTLLIGVVGLIAFDFISMRIDHMLYNYEKYSYKHEIDSLIRPELLKNVKFKYVYKSSTKSSIYYMTIDSTNNIIVLQTTNFNDIYIQDIEINKVDKIELTDGKTYSTIVMNGFPILQVALNPKESNYAKISIENPNKLDNPIKLDHYYFIKGEFKFVTIGNSQNCNIVSFPRCINNEILVIKHKENLYFFLQSTTAKSLLEFINSEFIQ